MMAKYFVCSEKILGSIPSLVFAIPRIVAMNFLEYDNFNIATQNFIVLS